MKRLFEITLLLVVAVGPKYYGYSRPNVYHGQNFYAADKTYIGASRTDLRGGYRYVDKNKTYKGYQRGGDGKTYVPGLIK